MNVLEFYDWCAGVYAKWNAMKAEEDEAFANEYLDGVVKLAAVKMRQAPATLWGALTRLPLIPRQEVVDHPELGVAHWLVLAELVPDNHDLRRFWIHRTKFMGFSARSVRSELGGALELQRQIAAGEIVPRPRRAEKR